MNDARQSAIEDLIADVIDHLDQAETGLKRLHDMQANKVYGLTWEAFMQRFFGKSRKWLYRQLHAAEGIRKLNELGVSSLGQSSAALQAFAEVPDELTAEVYYTAKDTDGKLTENRVKDALADIRTTIQTGAVETADGDMLLVRDVISEHVEARAAGRRSGRDDCRWVVSRADAEFVGIIGDWPHNQSPVFEARVLLPKAIEIMIANLAGQGKHVFLSIGIADESAADHV